jgi:hypothetical protein
VGTPGIGASLRLGIRATAREGWLLPVAAAIALVRSISTLPAFAVAAALALEGAGAAARLRPFSLVAPLEGGEAVLTSPRFLALVAGLWLAGTAVAGLLRVLFLAGALPTLAASMAGVDPTRRFAAGVLWGFPRQLGTWLLAVLAELGALGYLVAAAIVAGRLVPVHQEGLRPLLLAFAGGLALSAGAAGLVASRVLGDAAAARAAILDELPAHAFAGAVRRFLVRPGAFVLAGLALAFAGAAVGSLLQPATGAIGALAGRVQGPVLLGPQLMLALLAALGAAAVEVAWLATVSALACADVAGGGPRVSA